MIRQWARKSLRGNASGTTVSGNSSHTAAAKRRNVTQGRLLEGKLISSSVA
jgi:hypothetical protein